MSLPSNLAGRGVSWRQLVSRSDSLLCSWLDLYQISFPLAEQVKVSLLLSALDKAAAGTHPACILSAVESAEAGVVDALMCHGDLVPDKALWLWYLAVRPELRNAGLGSLAYQSFLTQLHESSPQLHAVAFEVERPDQSHDAAQRALAERRIRFYQRNGAKLVANVVYYQDLGWQPRVKMYLMVHPLATMDSVEIAGIIRDGFGSAVEPFETLVLE